VNFDLTFGPHYDPRVDSDFKRNIRVFPEGKGGRCVGLTTFPLLCADSLEIMAASTS